MNLKIKTTGMVTIISLLLVFALYMSLKFTILDIFTELEQNKIKQDIIRLEITLENELLNLEAIGISWGEWDDTYFFVDDLNEDYITNNLVETVFINQKLNTMIFVNKERKIVYSKTVILDEKREIETPFNLIQYVTNHTDNLFNIEINQGKIGFIQLEDKMILVSIRPITTSKINAPPNGYILIGRYLNQNEIKKLQNVLQLPFEILKLSKVNSDVLQNLKEDKYFIRSYDKINIEAYVLLKNINNEPIGVLKICYPRDIYAVGIESLYFFLCSLITVTLAFIFLMIFFLDKMILTRIQELTTIFHRVINNGDLTLRVNVSGRDEIAYLATTINKLFDSLKNTQIELEYASFHDSLTGLLNRNSFEEVMKEIMSQNNTVISIVVCDVDGLKFVNDQFGHHEGDNLLKLSADIIKKCFRTNDKIFRIGGDEFVIILPTLSEETVENICSRVKETIVKYNEENMKMPISISIGYAVNKLDTIDVAALFKEADDKMYEQKYKYHDSTRKLMCNIKNEEK